MVLKLANNASSALAGAILAADTALAVTSGDAGKFPTLAAGEWFPLTIVDNASNMEIVRVTARVGATLTIVRGQEGTTAKDFASGSLCDIRLTAAAMAEFPQLHGADFPESPRVPTPDPGDDSSKVPNTGWVQDEIDTAFDQAVDDAVAEAVNTIRDGAPTEYDTLKKVADRLGNDPTLSLIPDWFVGCVPAWVSTTSIALSAGLGVFGGKKHILPAFTKLLNAQWAAGNNVGMMDTGPVQTNKTYFLHAIRNLTTGDSDYLASLSLSAPSVPSGWERLSGSRVGLALTNSAGSITFFKQIGSECKTDVYSWFTASADVAGLAIPSNIPIGLSVDAHVLIDTRVAAPGTDIIAFASGADAATGFGQIPQDVRARSRSGNDYPDQSTSAGYVRTNASGQIYRFVDTSAVSVAAADYYVDGWRDYQCTRLSA